MKTKLLLFLAMAAAMPAAIFQVTMDTNGLSTQSGTIDIQFNPGSCPGPYEAGSAVITSFNLGTGTLGSLVSGPDGGASGTLVPGPLTILNSDFLNGVLYNATFGDLLTFDVDFTGSAFTDLAPSVVSSLQVTLETQNGTLVASAGLLGDSQLDTSASSRGVSFKAAGAAVPEPATFGLFAMGMAAVALAARKRK